MTFEEICSRMAAEYEAMAGFAPEDASDAGIRIKVLAGEIYTALCMLEAVKTAAFPQTASGAELDLHAEERGLQRKAAVQAAGTLTFSRETALSYDVEIPAGTVCAASAAAAEFETTETVVLPAGELAVTAKARAVNGGKAYNAAVGVIDTLVTPPAGIEAVTNGTAFSGGTDAESDDALRMRLLQCYSVLPNGTNSETYRRAALEVPGAAHANVAPREQGIGTVSVYLYGAGEPVTEAVLQAVQEKLDGLREINVDVSVLAAESVTKRVTAYITPKPNCSFEEAKTLCEAAVQRCFAELTVGSAFAAAAVTAAVMQTGAVQNCVLAESVADYVPGAGEIVVPGEITILKAS